ncbi:hypothetical protein VKT23_008628 [Stygiomarasmius scandens]|uniref:PA14 domain-containing protein n=1 Tax=Marasmiellus scandens TaxID=2682957 RepID=A0ABR1JI29_9AGAR
MLKFLRVYFTCFTLLHAGVLLTAAAASDGSMSLLPRQINPTNLNFANSQWIWTNEVPANSSTPVTAPVGTRAFRKTFSPPQGKIPFNFFIAVATDNNGTLFVNGKQITVSPDWLHPQTFCVSNFNPTINVIALNVTNQPGNTGPNANPAGLLVAARVLYLDGTTTDIVSDASWRFSLTVPPGFESLTFDDSSWPTATTEGKVPISPWGNVTILNNATIC